MSFGIPFHNSIAKNFQEFITWFCFKPAFTPEYKNYELYKMIPYNKR
jgi:hypothetical protein